MIKAKHAKNTKYQFSRINDASENNFSRNKNGMHMQLSQHNQLK